MGAAQAEAPAAQVSIPNPLPLDYEPQSTEELLACARASAAWRICSGHIYKIIVKESDEDEGGVVKPFIPNRAQRRFLRKVHNRNVILKARQLGFCVDPSTRVLTADLRWVAIADLRPGDEIVACDEDVPGGRGKARQMRTATVQASKTMQAERYRITLDDGREIICTANHPWLTRKARSDAQWRSISGKGNRVVGRIKPGTLIRSITEPWSDGDIEDGWMGGMIDGEGSIALPSRAGSSVCVSQRPGPVFDRMVAYAQSRGFSYRIEDDDGQRESKHGTTPVPKIVFSRTDEVFRLIGQTRPTRGLQHRFWEGRELPGKRNADNRAWATVESIEPIGVGPVVDLQTSTGTYVAEGLVSHNTTLISIMWLDHALWVSDQRCAIVAHTLPDAEMIFRDKVKFAYLNMPAELRELFPLERDSAGEIVFAHNNSSVRVATSARSGTTNRLHISEMGKIAAKFPQKAVEITTGSLPSVPQDGIAVIESTAEGKSGKFYDIASRAEKRAHDPAPLGKNEFAFHFFPWHITPEYKTDPRFVRIKAEEHEYFDQVGEELDTRITLPQRAWYIAKRENEQAGDVESMWREYPSTPAECWQKSTAGTFFAPQILRARAEGRITKLRHVSEVAVHTFWDIGAGDGCGIWAMQHIGNQHRFLGYFEDWAQSYGHYVKMLRETGWLFGVHHLPHDASHERPGKHEVETPLSMLQEVAPDWRFTVVPRVQDLSQGIQLTRQKLTEAWFDAEGCEAGIEHLELYHKKWNARIGAFSEEPEKLDGHSEAADSIRQWAQGFDPNVLAGPRFPRSHRRRPKGGLVA